MTRLEQQYVSRVLHLGAGSEGAKPRKSHEERLDRLASRTVTRIWHTMSDELTINPDEAIRLVRQAIEGAYQQGLHATR